MSLRLRHMLMTVLAAVCLLLPACGPAPSNVSLPGTPNSPAAEEGGDGLAHGGIGLVIAFAIAVIVFHRREKEEP
jgi:hypothetical protein